MRTLVLKVNLNVQKTYLLWNHAYLFSLLLNHNFSRIFIKKELFFIISITEKSGFFPEIFELTLIIKILANLAIFSQFWPNCRKKKLFIPTLVIFTSISFCGGIFQCEFSLEFHSKPGKWALKVKNRQISCTFFCKEYKRCAR